MCLSVSGKLRSSSFFFSELLSSLVSSNALGQNGFVRSVGWSFAHTYRPVHRAITISGQRQMEKINHGTLDSSLCFLQSGAYTGVDTLFWLHRNRRIRQYISQAALPSPMCLSRLRFTDSYCYPNVPFMSGQLTKKGITSCKKRN